jgi:hypothetical protein
MNHVVVWSSNKFLFHWANIYYFGSTPTTAGRPPGVVGRERRGGRNATSGTSRYEPPANRRQLQAFDGVTLFDTLSRVRRYIKFIYLRIL